MAKKALTITITLLAIIGLCFGITYFTNTNFIDYSFIIGLVVTIVIWFFTSSGGFTSRYTDASIQKDTTNFIMKSQKYKFKPNIVFLTSLTYTIIFFIAMLIHYRSYL
jgi:hypothetical protein